MALSKNFDVQMNKRALPECYKKFDVTSKAKPKLCGACWFAHDCKAGKKRANDKKNGGSYRETEKSTNGTK